jgi:hypothetical protein
MAEAIEMVVIKARGELGILTLLSKKYPGKFFPFFSYSTSM